MRTLESEIEKLDALLDYGPMGIEKVAVILGYFPDWPIENRYRYEYDKDMPDGHYVEHPGTIVFFLTVM